MRALGAALALLALPASAGAADGLWELLRAGGQVVLLPHATTGGAPGDPAGFRLADCTTQRNLSAAGREEARRIGRAFRARRIPVASVMSSRWCRCLETALLAFDRVEPWPALDSFSDDLDREGAQSLAVRTLAGDRPAGGNVVLVTHPVNITALTGATPAPGEMVILTPQGAGEFKIAGRLLVR
ncbi:MAG: histidine phosphatase family protein [Candidatus Rokubacteria bacterium]|nr:histidine phosphatase family protein [Candidatus Rokubacteria bacterium]